MKQVTLFSTYAILLLSIMSLTTGYNYSDIDRLLQEKLLSYNKRIRPLNNQSETLTIHITFELITVIELDEVLERISVVGLMEMYYTDELMIWDPEEYGGVDYVITESEDFWTPNLVLVNTYDNLEKLGEKWTIVRYFPSGFTTYTPGQIFPATCSVDIKFYPWDEQTCFFVFTPFGFDESEVKLVTIDDKVRFTYFSPNGIWDIVDSSARNRDEVGATFSITVKRKPQFIIVNVILPILIMSVLNIVVFWIPTENGERISYCLTVLLSIAVFLTLVGDNLPKKSNPMAYFSFYLLCVLVLAVCVTFSAIYSLRIYFVDNGVPVSQFWICIVKVTRCDWCRRLPMQKQQSDRAKYRKPIVNRPEGQKYSNGRLAASVQHQSLYVINTEIEDGERMSADKISQNISLTDNKNHLTDDINNMHSETETNTDCFKGSSKREYTWKEVSVAFDKICFLFYTMALISITSAFMLMTSRII